MNKTIEYLIDEEECVACVHSDCKCYDDPCYNCLQAKGNPSFSPDSEDAIIARYTRNA